MQIMHALYTSGLRYSQYERFCDGSMFGKCHETLFINTHDMYCDATEELTKESVIEARQEEEISSNTRSRGEWSRVQRNKYYN